MAKDIASTKSITESAVGNKVAPGIPSSGSKVLPVVVTGTVPGTR